MLEAVKNEKGSVVVMAVIVFVSLLGFGALAVDIGYLFLNKTQLANMADAAALAGAQDLPVNPQQAQADANSYAGVNGNPGDGVQAVVSNNNTTVSVTVTRKVPLFFAKVFNLSWQNISAQAAASIKQVSSADGVVPFGVVKENFIYGQTYYLKAGAGSGYDGNYGALALGGTGANVYNNNIQYGYDRALHVGDWIPTQTGNISGQTIQGVNYRINLDPTATYATVQDSSPRIVTVPIIDSLNVNGQNEVQIVGFAAFFLEGVGGSGNDNYVYGEFMQLVVSGDTSIAAGDYGLYSASLIQ